MTGSLWYGMTFRRWCGKYQLCGWPDLRAFSVGSRSGFPIRVSGVVSLLGLVKYLLLVSSSLITGRVWFQCCVSACCVGTSYVVAPVVEVREIFGKEEERKGVCGAGKSVVSGLLL